MSGLYYFTKYSYCFAGVPIGVTRKFSRVSLDTNLYFTLPKYESSELFLQFLGYPRVGHTHQGSPVVTKYGGASSYFFWRSETRII